MAIICNALARRCSSTIVKCDIPATSFRERSTVEVIELPCQQQHASESASLFNNKVHVHESVVHAGGRAAGAG